MYIAGKDERNKQTEEYDNQNPIWNMPIEQIDSWIENNVTDLASANNVV
jgi:hypothetical protein